jgi:hypothetical protein
LLLPHWELDRARCCPDADANKKAGPHANPNPTITNNIARRVFMATNYGLWAEEVVRHWTLEERDRLFDDYFGLSIFGLTSFTFFEKESNSTTASI